MKWTVVEKTEQRASKWDGLFESLLDGKTVLMDVGVHDTLIGLQKRIASAAFVRRVQISTRANPDRDGLYVKLREPCP